MIKDSGTRRTFDTGGQRDAEMGKGRFDLLPPYAIRRLAQHFEEGAQKYDDRNWELGIPLSSFLDSALRHIFKFMEGLNDEPHLVAAAWNLLCLIETEYRIGIQRLPEGLDDLPDYVRDK